MQWYYMKADTKKRFGPFSDSELKQQAKSGALRPSDFIWRQGMQKAVPASKVKGLFPQAAVPVQSPITSAPNVNTPSGNIPTVKSQVARQNGGVTSMASETVPVPKPVPQQSTPFGSEDSFDFPAPPSESDTPLHWEPLPIQSQRSAAAASAMAESSQPQTKTREDQLWDEGSSSSETWTSIWKGIHKIGANNRWIYFVIPPMVALPVGIVSGILDAMNPVIYISFILAMIIYGFLGMIVFECFKGAGIRVRILSAAYGFFTACVGVWAFVYGGMLWDIGVIVPDEKPNISAVGCMSPVAMVKYIQIKAENMTLGRIGRHSSSDNKPNLFFNYLFILGMLVVEFVCVVTTAWGPMKLQSEQAIEESGY